MTPTQLQKEAEELYPVIDRYGLTLARRAAYLAAATKYAGEAVEFAEWQGKGNWRFDEKRGWWSFPHPEWPYYTTPELYLIFKQQKEK